MRKANSKKIFDTHHRANSYFRSIAKVWISGRRGSGVVVEQSTKHTSVYSKARMKSLLTRTSKRRSLHYELKVLMANIMASNSHGNN